MPGVEPKHLGRRDAAQKGLRLGVQEREVATTPEPGKGGRVWRSQNCQAAQRATLAR